MPLKKKGKKKKKKKIIVIEPTRFKTYTFLSLGGICRAPLASGLLQSYLRQNTVPPDLGVTVKNFATSYLHYGELPHPSGQKCAKNHGFNILNYKSEVCKKMDIVTSTVLIVFDEDGINEINQLKEKYGLNGGLTPIRLLSEYFPKDPNLPKNIPDFYYCRDTDSGAESIYQLMLKAMPALYQEIVAKPKRELD